jgi:DnaJ-class molecular chaperone
MFVEAFMIGKSEKTCSENETVCPTCNGSTVGDFGQPFECETCLGTGSIPFFERPPSHRK